MRRAAGRGGRRGGDGGPDRGDCGAAPGARRRHRPARRQRFRGLPRHPGVPAEVRRRRRRRARQGQPRATGAHLRPGDAALPRGVSLGQRPRRRGLHRRARAGAVRGDRRLEARPGGARRRDVPEPVRDQRLEAAAVADQGRGPRVEGRRGGGRGPRAPPGFQRGRPASGGEGRRTGGAGRVRAAGADAGDQVRTDGAPAARRPDVRELGGLRQRPRRTAEAALLALLAERRLGADPRPVAPRPEPVRARRGARPDPGRGRRPGLLGSATPSTWSAGRRWSSMGLRRSSRARSACC